ncbi:MAG: hypothetical protein K5905_08200 [Roseibium sp.]|uniref:hypothetical protein n=1 Tax=Roseibium sp. TaxID=1936156 RepID=UPI002609F2A4|nr:hypothetical protein [Roseibium sp.]MCV0425441.1 hypothetical protein [Roseibium sp.]
MQLLYVWFGDILKEMDTQGMAGDAVMISLCDIGRFSIDAPLSALILFDDERKVGGIAFINSVTMPKMAVKERLRVNLPVLESVKSRGVS